MKRLIVSAVLAIAFCTASFAAKVVAKGPTFTALGDYMIETAADPAVINGEECKTFTISYENSPMSVKVVVCSRVSAQDTLLCPISFRSSMFATATISVLKSLTRL